MGRILCATRGGADSRRMINAAIALARDRGDDLIFLYVADVSFLDTIAAPLVVDVEAEVSRMGAFQLAMAQEQAAEQGVNAQALVRRGHLREELIEVARQLGATDIVLGQPRGEDSHFDQLALGAFAHDLHDQTGAKVHVL